MRIVFSLVVLTFVLCSSIAVKAEVAVDESLRKNYSYIDAAPELEADAMTFLLLESNEPNQPSETSESKSQPQCFATNKHFVNCRN